MFIELLNRRIDHFRRFKFIQPRPARFYDPRRLILEPGLIRSHFLGLRRPHFSIKHLKALPAEPAIFMVIPHADEGPTRPRILQIGIVKIGAVNGAIVIQRRRDVKIVNLLAMLVANDVAQFSIVHALRTIFRIPDDLVNEIAQVQNEIEPLVFGRAQVFEDHAPIRVLRALIRVLATDEGEPDRARIIVGRRRDGAADATAIAAAVAKAIPINPRRLQASH